MRQKRRLAALRGEEYLQLPEIWASGDATSCRFFPNLVRDFWPLRELFGCE